MKHYDFRFGNDNAGWFEILEEPERIWMKAVFDLDGEDYENEFELRIVDGAVTAYRYGAGEWRDMPEGEDIYPGSAYPLLISRLTDTLTFRSLREEDGEIIGVTTLTREGDEVIERLGDTETRRFTLRDGEIIRIDWGGPVSHLHDSLESAQAGSKYGG